MCGLMEDNQGVCRNIVITMWPTFSRETYESVTDRRFETLLADVGNVKNLNRRGKISLFVIASGAWQSL
ncbi:MAG: hypothetical protein COA54_05200 [Thiotrichaceae bacterium]|nr:MAG: hypothetical protein COA54_05200 [Thiotrichaceae bacterium]